MTRVSHKSLGGLAGQGGGSVTKPQVPRTNLFKIISAITIVSYNFVVEFCMI